MPTYKEAMSKIDLKKIKKKGKFKSEKEMKEPKEDKEEKMEDSKYGTYYMSKEKDGKSSCVMEIRRIDGESEEEGEY